MKKLISFAMLVLLVGCSPAVLQKTTSAGPPKCLGDTDIPAEFASGFVPAEDDDLLNSALGAANEGKLCWGRVYESTGDSRITVYRAWNSTNPGSKMGSWWAFREPAGKVSQYRSEYEICYQWSPLDKLVVGTLKPGTKVVVGTGQSARCSEYLTYPVSGKKQIFIEDASGAVVGCKVYDLIFSWRQ